MPTIQGPQFGVTKMPIGEKASSHPDIQTNRLVAAIEKQGARLAWSRAADCPCTPVNDQTKQADPNCALCKGTSVIYFGPKDYVVPAEAGELTEVQKAIVAVDGAAVIRGVLASATQEADLYDVLGRWTWGVHNISVRPENKIGYYDRLVNLDSEICFFETVTAIGGVSTIPLRYKATGVNLVRSLDAVFVEGAHYTVELGQIVWTAASVPASDVQVSVHYLTPPTWRVVDHPHVVRESSIYQTASRKTPFGSPTILPIQGKVKLEFIPVE